MHQLESLLQIAIEIHTNKKVSSLNAMVYQLKCILSSELCEKH